MSSEFEFKPIPLSEFLGDYSPSPDDKKVRVQCLTSDGPRGKLVSHDEHFDAIPGSNRWPSGDPEDSPFDIFVCRHCGHEIHQRMYGEWSLYEPSPGDRLVSRLTYHLAGCPEVRR